MYPKLQYTGANLIGITRRSIVGASEVIKKAKRHCKSLSKALLNKEAKEATEIGCQSSPKYLVRNPPCTLFWGDDKGQRRSAKSHISASLVKDQNKDYDLLPHYQKVSQTDRTNHPLAMPALLLYLPDQQFKASPVSSGSLQVWGKSRITKGT